MPTELKLGETLAGVISSTTNDAFTFDVATGGELTFNLDFGQATSPGQYVAVKLVDSRGQVVLQASTKVGQLWKTVINQAGSYTLTVDDGHSWFGPASAQYTLSTAFSTKPLVTYEGLANNTASTADSIDHARPVVGALREFDTDFFKLSALHEGAIHLNFSHPDGVGALGTPLTVEIIESATGKVLEGRELNGSSSIRADLDGGGDYLIRVHNSTGGETGFYLFLATTTNRSQDDFIEGTVGNNQYVSSPGNDTFNGNGGFDTVRYNGYAAGYRIASTDAGIMVEHAAGTDGRDALINVSRISFVDRTIDFGDLTDAAKVYRLYDAAFDRAPDETGLGFWINVMQQGVSLHAVASGFVASPEFTAKYSQASNSEVVAMLYQNILERVPDTGGLAFWTTVLNNGGDLASIVEAFGESPEHQAMLVGQISDGVTYIPYLG